METKHGKNKWMDKQKNYRKVERIFGLFSATFWNRQEDEKLTNVYLTNSLPFSQ